MMVGGAQTAVRAVSASPMNDNHWNKICELAKNMVCTYNTIILVPRYAWRPHAIAYGGLQGTATHNESKKAAKSHAFNISTVRAR